jgi:glycosyltransferase involved in cell wall biosynthesis
VTAPAPMRIWAWQADEGGCGFYRIAEPMAALKRAGHQVNVRVQRQGFIEYAHLGNCGGPAELAVIQRIVLPDMAPAVRRLRTPPRRVIYEIDDDMFSIDPGNPDAFRLYNSPNIRDTLRLCADQSHLVTVSTEPLAEVMRRECSTPVVVLPNCVPDGMFEIERPRFDRPRIGWAGGMGHDNDMRCALTPLRRFLDRTPEADLHIIGHDFRRTIARPRVYWSSWLTPMATYWRAIDFDIGIAPLAPTIFNRSKSALKALEYGALGIPTVASDAAPYREIIQHGVTGFLVQRDDQWVSYLRELTYDADLREQMGQAAREHVRQYALSRNWRRWEAAYGQVLGRDVARPAPDIPADIPAELVGS